MPEHPFISKLESSIDFCTPGSLTGSTRFRELPEWDSLTSLITLAVFDEVFGKQITADQLNSCKTLQEVIDLA